MRPNRDARGLVEMLRDMSGDPDALGQKAIAGWRAEAAAHGDRRLIAEIDSYDPATLAELWDRGCGYRCATCGSSDPWADQAIDCDDCAAARIEYLSGDEGGRR